jgi:GxxExxY protein
LFQQIKDAAFAVHKALGPGLLEQVYEICFSHELNKRNVDNGRLIKLPIQYDGIISDEGLRLDVLVNHQIICELKAIDTVNPIWQAQILSHLKLTGLHVGFIINFNTTLLKDGIRRFCVEKFKTSKRLNGKKIKNAFTGNTKYE